MSHALLCFAALASSVLAHAQIDDAAMLHALAAVETGCKPGAVGRKGERGEAQMMPAMRRHYGTPEAMLRDLERTLPRTGMPVSPYTVALIWHLGEPKIARRQISDTDADYARRVRNLYESQP